MNGMGGRNGQSANVERVSKPGNLVPRDSLCQNIPRKFQIISLTVVVLVKN